MKITTAQQKMILASLFITEQPDPMRPGTISNVPRNFPLGELSDAASAMKKLEEGGERKSFTQNGIIMESVNYVDKEIEFTPAETAILVKLFKAKAEWPIRDANVVLEVKEIIEPPRG